MASSKSKLNEMAQKNKLPLPTYNTVTVTNGFFSTVEFNGRQFKSAAICTKKKDAEQSAAKVALDTLMGNPSDIDMIPQLKEAGIFIFFHFLFLYLFLFFLCCCVLFCYFVLFYCMLILVLRFSFERKRLELSLTISFLVTYENQIQIILFWLTPYSRKTTRKIKKKWHQMVGIGHSMYEKLKCFFIVKRFKGSEDKHQLTCN